MHTAPVDYFNREPRAHHWYIKMALCCFTLYCTSDFHNAMIRIQKRYHPADVDSPGRYDLEASGGTTGGVAAAERSRARRVHREPVVHLRLLPRTRAGGESLVRQRTAALLLRPGVAFQRSNIFCGREIRAGQLEDRSSEVLDAAHLPGHLHKVHVEVPVGKVHVRPEECVVQPTGRSSKLRWSCAQN